MTLNPWLALEISRSPWIFYGNSTILVRLVGDEISIYYIGNMSGGIPKNVSNEFSQFKPWNMVENILLPKQPQLLPHVLGIF